MILRETAFKIDVHIAEKIEKATAHCLNKHETSRKSH